MNAALRAAALPALLGAGLLLASLVARPLMPPDETRLASVAWEMWTHGDWIVPHLNGVPYSHKPPLLYWIVGLLWRTFGVSAAWVRIVPALFGLSSLVVTAHLARRLWPSTRGAPALAPWVLLGTAFWTAFGTLLATYDAALAFFVLVGVTGILRASDGSARSGFALAGLALGFGLLAKGPVLLVHLLPVALLAPWWAGGPVRDRWRAWYGGLALALLLGFTLALAWVVPATLLGGSAYRGEILWNQTAHRLVDSFAHRRSWWFYLAFLPVVLAPWSLWPATWRGIARLVQRPDRGVRFTLAWGLPPPILLSLVSGKQVYYLLPILPAFALLLARSLASEPERRYRGARIPTAIVVVAVGALVLALSSGALRGLPEWSAQIPPWVGIALLLGGLALPAVPQAGVAREVLALAGITTFFLLVLHAGALRPVLTVLDLRGVAEVLRRAEQEGRPIAHAGFYEGQYHFLGRLVGPLEVIEPSRAIAWARGHPRGQIVLYSSVSDPRPALPPEYAQPSRGRIVQVWSSEGLLQAQGGLSTSRATRPGTPRARADRSRSRPQYPRE